MRLGLKLPKYKKENISSEIIKYKEPKFVYIPLIVQWDENITVLIKKGDKVKKGELIAKSKGCFRTPIFSSVSGVVKDFEEKYYTNGKLVKCIVIENDFKEEYKTENKNNQKINLFSKEEFVNKIHEAGIVGLGGSGFPTFVKYEIEKELKTLIVNAVECEPYLTADHALLKEKCEEILEAIDAIMEINNIPEGIIAIKNTNKELKEHLSNYLGTYLNIKVVEVPNLYPMGWERNLVKYVKKTTYKKYPIEKGIVVNNSSTIYSIYETLKYNKPLLERTITIAGDGVLNQGNYLVKIGTEVKEIIESAGGYTSDSVTLIAGGPMMGYAVASSSLIVSSNLTSVIILKGTCSEKETDCLRCGKCIEACPVKLSPVLIKDAVESGDYEKTLRASSCVECGLCSFVCPSKIDVRSYVKKAKEGRLD